MSRYRVFLFALLAVVVGLALTAAGCGDDDKEATTGTATTTEEPKQVSGSIRVQAVWSGPEQKAFKAVLAGFKEKQPDVTVKYKSAGDQLPTVLSTAVEGGKPPDIAVLPQPGLIKEFVGKDALQPLDFAKDAISANFSEDWSKLGTQDGKLYALFFKGANKSTIWYNTKIFEDAGVEPPKTIDELVEAAETIKSSGTPAYSIGADVGWPLTDIFENIYLRQAGPEKYDQLAAHEIPWTDQSVKDALAEMAKIVGDGDNLAGGTSGALQTDFPTSVSNAFGAKPKGAMVLEGDFVSGVITDSTKSKPETDFNVFEFPSINDSGPAVVGGGDAVVMFKDSPAAQALIQYLATPEAAEIWAKLGGFSSPNKNLDPAVYPDEITRTTAAPLGKAETFRFDMSDLQPAAFGGTAGQGMWKFFTDFLKDPKDIDGIASKLEKAAAKAFK